MKAIESISIIDTCKGHNATDQWVAIWSLEEGDAGYVVRLDWFLTRQFNVFVTNCTPTWVLLGGPFPSEEEASRFLTEARNFKENRSALP